MMMKTETKPYVGAEEIAEILGVPVGRVWAMTRTGRIPCLRLGRKTYRYQVEAVITALEEGRGNDADHSTTALDTR